MTLPLSPANRRYGYKNDSADFRDVGMVGLREIFPYSMFTSNTDKYDLEAMTGPVKDQGDLGACTAFAGCGMREFLYRKYNPYESHKDVPADQGVFSPMYLYYREREYEGTLGEDSGAQMRTISKMLNKWGTCLETEDTYSPRDFTKAPTAEQIASGYNFRGGAYHRLGNVYSMKSCIRSGYVFVLGFSVYESFESQDVARSGLMPVPDPGHEMLLGGHAVLVIGYDDSVHCPKAQSPGALKIRNSWGPSWGQSGDFYMAYEAAADPALTMDCWTQHLGRAWK